jgi:hypothetical protein
VVVIVVWGVFVRVVVGVRLADFVLVLGFWLVGVLELAAGLLVLQVVFGLGFVGVRCGFGEVAVFEDVDLDGGDAAAVYRLDFEGGVEAEGGGGFVQDFGGDAGVDESAEEHVSSDSGKAVEISYAHLGWVLGCVGQPRAAAMAEAGSTSFMEPVR